MLVAFMTPENVDVESVRDFISDHLPHYMIPSIFITLENLPLNTNGKVDKKQLKQMEIQKTIEMPVTADEIKMAGIWSSLLDVDIKKIGRHTSFFELGGDSISSIVLVSKCHDFDWILTSIDVMKYQTLKRITRFVMTENEVISLESLLKNDFDLKFEGTIKLFNPLYSAEFRARPLRLVCLHGQGANKDILKLQLSHIKRYLGWNLECIFIEALNACDSEFAALYNTQGYQWWCDGSDKKDVYKSLKFVWDSITKLGSVDAIMGFSQGGTLIELLDQFAASQIGLMKTWKFSVILSAIPMNPYEFENIYSELPLKPLKSRCIIVSGIKERLMLSNFSKISDRYDYSSVIIEHTQGHEIPQYEKFTKSFCEQLLRMALAERANEYF
ncbi:serine hydrolase-domain-containing protein [Globomyces pollinis-pini]|nr:serine hydrolase-domain-containing protein [Globomyces pollinis-pini]